MLSRWFAAGGAIAVALMIPDLWWQAQHGWATIVMTHALNGRNGGIAGIGTWIFGQLGITVLAMVWVWPAGLRFLWQSGRPMWRAVAWAYGLLFVIFMLTTGKHQIGEALAEVDAHCRDAGQAPGHAFGDPVGYALARAQNAGLDNRKRVSPPLAALQAGAATASVGGLLSGVDAVAHHAPGTVTAGQVIPVVLAPPHGRHRRRCAPGAAAGGLCSLQPSRPASAPLPSRSSCGRR